MRAARITCLSATILLLAATVFAADEKASIQRTLTFAVGASGAKDAAPVAECVVTFGPSAPVSAVAFSPDGKTLASGGYREVLLWDLVEARLARRIGVGELDGRVGALAFLDDGKTLAVGDGVPGKSGGVKLLDLAEGKRKRTLDGPADAVHGIAVSADGKLLAACGAFKEIYVWSVADGKLLHKLEGHDDWIADVAFSPDGLLLASAGLDKTLQIWKTDTGERTLRAANPDSLHAVAFTPDSKSVLVAVGGPGEHAVRTWRTDNARWSRAVNVEGGLPLDIAPATKARRNYVACSDGTVKGVPTWSGRATEMSGHVDWVYVVTLNADETRLASAGADGTVRLWNAADGTPIATLVQLVPSTDQWLIVTAQGWFAASSPEALSCRKKDAGTSDETLREKLRHIESVRKVLAGEKVAAPEVK